MSLIESSSSITSNFYCSYGFAKTNIEWEKPNFKKIKLYFLELLNKTNIFKKYKVIIVGKSLYNINATTDIDLHLIGNEKDYIPEELENDFSLLYNKAFEKQILVDICFKEKEEPKILNLSSLNLTEFELLNYTKNNFRIRPAYFKKIKNNSNYIINNIKCH